MNNNSIICEKLNIIIDAYGTLKEAIDARDSLENLKLGHKPRTPNRRIAKEEPVIAESKLVRSKKVTWGAYLLCVPATLLAMMGLGFPDTNFFWFSVLAGMYLGIAIPFGWIWAFIYTFFIFSKKKDQDVERIKNSPEFKKKVEAAKRAREAKQEEYNKQYEEEYKIYEEKLKAWNTENEKFEADRKKSIEKYQFEIDDLRTFIDEIYDQLYAFGGIPSKYRSRDVASYLVRVLSTTTYTLKDGLEMYDRQQLIELQNQRLAEQQRQNALQEEANDRAAYMNELQERANEVAEKTRRDQNIANAALLHQSQKRTEMMKKHNKQMEREARRRY